MISLNAFLLTIIEAISCIKTSSVTSRINEKNEREIKETKMWLTTQFILRKFMLI